MPLFWFVHGDHLYHFLVMQSVGLAYLVRCFTSQGGGKGGKVIRAHRHSRTALVTVTKSFIRRLNKIVLGPIQ